MLQSVYFEVKNVQDKHNLKQMKKGLDTLYGILAVSLNKKDHRIGVDYDTTGITEQQIENYLNDRGYNVSNVYDLKI
ncbi:MAG: heavy metal-associated domain protein [Clostridium sp.]|nr:heavy metal-associated domain protein [Clostridium sp.]